MTHGAMIGSAGGINDGEWSLTIAPGSERVSPDLVLVAGDLGFHLLLLARRSARALLATGLLSYLGW